MCCPLLDLDDIYMPSPYGYHSNGGLAPCIYGQEADARRFPKHNTESACVVLSGREFHWATVFEALYLDKADQPIFLSSSAIGHAQYVFGANIVWVMYGHRSCAESSSFSSSS